MKKLICILTYLCCATQLYSFTPVASNYEIAVGNDLKLVSQEKQEDNPAAKYSIHIKYPQFTSSKLSPAAQLFDADMQKFAIDEIAEFKNRLTELEKEPINIPADLSNSFEINFQAGVFNVADNKLVVIRFNKESMYAGAAHPSHEIEVYNFDLTAGRKLQLSDLFKPQSNYLKILSDFCYAQLSKHFTNADDQVLRKGTAPKAQNFANWNLEPDGILIIFDEYQVAAYVDGQPEVFVPYKILEKAILPTAIIETCIKNPKRCSAI